jgi:hypothetical protein
MYTGDSIYKFVLNYNFDLYRGELEVSEYLEKHFNKYTSDLQVTIHEDNPFLGTKFISMLEDKLPLISEICSQIVNISKKYSQGLIKEAYIKAYDLFDDIYSYFLPSSSNNERNRFFYRLRSGDFRITDHNKSKEKKAELFHIKRNKKHLINAYRYSVSGFPCLYLASGQELAWFECGMPKQFSYCQMIIDKDEDGENTLRLVDFSNRPIEFLSNIHINLLNYKNDENTKEIIYQYFLKYIITYPLVATCSIKVKNRSNNFVEEYVIPQIFMQWIRESNYFAGVIYKSSLDSNLVQGMGAINIALPVKEFRLDGLGENLTSKISVSNIGYLDVNEDFQKYKTYLDDIEKFKNDIESDFINSKYQGSYLWGIIELCETVIKTYDALMNGNYKNTELIFSHIDCLANHISIIYRNKKSIADECINEVPDYNKKEVDKDKIIKQINEFYQLMSKVVHKHMVFHFNFESLENYEKI